jgi:hypothetical protein
MSQSNPATGFTETHHALLFGWLARAIIEAAGDTKGEAVVRAATRQYGAERGRRMALRARGNRHALTTTNYLAYSEWVASPGVMKQVFVEKAPHARVHVHLCPWHTLWQEHELLPYGRLYCLEIDKALVNGFNPRLVVEVNGTRTNGADRCEFVFREANLTWSNYLLLGFRKAVSPGQKAHMPWEYHAGHLFTTFEKAAGEALGEPGQRAVGAALAEFTRYFGEGATQTLLAFRNTDFAHPPE